MKRIVLWLAVPVALLAAVFAHAHWPLSPFPDEIVADSIVVLKSERKLFLLHQGRPLREYRIALGGDPVGTKREEGDQRTPEGRYVIDYRNDHSAYHLALHISYPDENDRLQAAARGVNPGGLIMIHGTGSSDPLIDRWHRLLDWTHGCIAVTNEEIEQIWRAVPDGTPIEIRP
jgi:murein L,D-transpeptidase YafK